MINKWSIRLAAILILFSAVCFTLSSVKTDTDSLLVSEQKQLDRYLNQVEEWTNQYLSTSRDYQLIKKLDELPLSVEIYMNDSVRYWNSAAMLVSDESGDFTTLKKIGDDRNYGIIGISLSAYNTLHPNVYLKLTHDNGIGQLKIGEKSFEVSLTQTTVRPWLRLPAWLLLLAGFLSWSLWLMIGIRKRQKEGSLIYKEIILLMLGFLAVKALHYFPFFQELMEGTALTETINHLCPLNSSIAHFVLNLAGAGILLYFMGDILRWVIDRWRISGKILAVFTFAFTYLVFAYSASLMEGFVMNRVVNLEIESLLKFNAVSFVLISGFVIVMLYIFHSTQVLFEALNQTKISLTNKIAFGSMGWAIGLILSLWLMGIHLPIIVFSIYVIAYSLILDAYTENNDRKITYLIWWIIMFSGYMASALFYFGLKKDIEERSQFIRDYYVNYDQNIAQKIVALQDTLVARDVFTSIASLEGSETLNKDDLYQYLFNDLSSDYDSLNINIELFDKNTGATVFGNHFADYHRLIQSYAHARIVARQVYHNPFEDRYISRLEIIRPIPVNASWYLFIIVTKKDDHEKINTPSSRYGFAVFANDKLIEKYDNYQAAPELSLVSSASDHQVINGYSFVVYQPSDRYKIVSWKKISGLIKPISLFSFIFTLSGILLLILTVLNTRFDFLPENMNFRFGSRSSLKTKIQLAVILLILFTFLIIGSITGIYFKNLIEANQINKEKEENTTIVNDIRADVQTIAEDDYAISYLSAKLSELSYTHNKELSLYDANGHLAASTIHGSANMRIPFQSWTLHDEEVNPSTSLLANLQNHEFIPLYLNNQNAFGYLDILRHSHDLSASNILEFLSTILNAYIFLFLIAGAIAITIANSITQPLEQLAEKLKKFKLGKTNELLEWKSNDEIGTLIDDYNNLTQELEKSAGLLAKTERDMAWREMAKQVAHEIKNPLTPMKLNIQYLQRATMEHPERAGEMIPRVSSALIEQIDNLTQIANEFSNFATIPQASNEKIILNEIVETVHDLFRKRDDMDISMVEPIDELYVFADKNHLVRILNNLLRNAIQAIPEDRRGKIDIELSRKGSEAVIRISDNGTGIPDHMKDKVFTPNFTTKSSGTGLGLAISANMIDSFNGRIYFETKVGKGTDFFVVIPLMRLDEYADDSKRVSLD